MTDTPSALADRTLREWAEAASENPVLKARVRELEAALRIALEYMPGRMGECDCSSCNASQVIYAALQPKESK